MNVKGLLRTAQLKLSKNSPVILTGLSIAGVATTAVMAVRATPKALELLDEEYEIRLQFEPPFTKLEKLKITWKVYVPSVLMGAATVTAIIGSNRISMQRNVALAGLYTLTERTLTEYQNKVVETIGENKAREIKEEITQDHLDANPASKNTIISTGNGNMLCYDTLSGRYFKSNMENIRSAMNDVNHDMFSNMWLLLNEWYNKLGLEGIAIGNDIGWDVDHLLEIDFTSKLTDEGEPCLVLEYPVTPSAALLR